MGFPFYNVESRILFDFAVNSLCPSFTANHHRKGQNQLNMKTILSQQEHLKPIESKLSNAFSKKEGKNWALGRQT